jgi:cytochrome c peroxidase
MRPKRARAAVLWQAGCAQCHSGNLLTDQQFHNIGVPARPGKLERRPTTSAASWRQAAPKDRRLSHAACAT